MNLQESGNIFSILFNQRVYRLKKPFTQFIKKELSSSLLTITCGLPGTWKTEIAEAVAQIKGYPLLRSDMIRLEVLKNEDIFDNKVAGNMNKRTMVYDEMFQQADRALNQSDGVILDATFVTQQLRKRAAAIATKHGLGFVILQTKCPQAVSLKRILMRTKDKYVSNALTEQAYFDNKKKFERVDIGNLKHLYPNLDITYLIVDTQYEQPQDWYITNKKKK